MVDPLKLLSVMIVAGAIAVVAAYVLLWGLTKLDDIEQNCIAMRKRKNTDGK